MDVKINKNKVIITKNLKRGETYRISKGKKAESISFFKNLQICKGFSSRTEDNMDIFLLDYDSCLLSVVKEDISYLQGNYYLPQAYIFTTGMRKEFDDYVGNFHVIFLSKHSPRDIIKMMEETHCDLNYIDSPLRNIGRAWVLRLSPKKGRVKPRFIEIYENRKESKRIKYRMSWFGEAVISTAHKKLLSKFYPEIKHPRYDSEDGLKKVVVQNYETRG